MAGKQNSIKKSQKQSVSAVKVAEVAHVASVAAPVAPAASLALPAGFVTSLDPFTYLKYTEKVRGNQLPGQNGTLMAVDTDAQKLSQALNCLDNPKALEKCFFEVIHPVGSLEAFLKESPAEQSASSRLISPILINSLTGALLAEMSKQEVGARAHSNVLLALISSGHCPTLPSLIDWILKEKQLVHLSVLISSAEGGVCDSEIVKILVFLVGELQLQQGVSDTRDQDISPPTPSVKSLLLRTLKLPKSASLMKKFLISIPTPVINKLTTYLTTILPRLSTPKRQVVLGWLALVVDSQYPLCLLDSEMLKTMSGLGRQLKKDLKEEEGLRCVGSLIGGIRRDPKLGQVLKEAGMDVNGFKAGSHYTIEVSDL